MHKSYKLKEERDYILLPLEILIIPAYLYCCQLLHAILYIWRNNEIYEYLGSRLIYRNCNTHFITLSLLSISVTYYFYLGGKNKIYYILDALIQWSWKLYSIAFYPDFISLKILFIKTKLRKFWDNFLSLNCK